MKKKNKIDVLGIIAAFQKDVLDKKPTMDKMTDDVRMMKFKIRPLQGDISLLNLNDTMLIEMLWNLGKLEEFYRNQNKKLTLNQKEIFFRFFDNMYGKFQDQLNKINLRTKTGRISSTIEMEIFKEESSYKKN